MEINDIQESANVLSVAMLDAKLHVAVLLGNGENERQEIKKTFSFKQLSVIHMFPKNECAFDRLVN